jgi:hypothetical protein
MIGTSLKRNSHLGGNKLDRFTPVENLPIAWDVSKVLQGILKGALLFDWFGVVCFTNKNKNCQLAYS